MASNRAPDHMRAQGTAFRLVGCDPVKPADVFNLGRCYLERNAEATLLRDSRADHVEALARAERWIADLRARLEAAEREREGLLDVMRRAGLAITHSDDPLAAVELLADELRARTKGAQEGDE